MNFSADGYISLTNLLAGMLLFKSDISDRELSDVISKLFNDFKIDVYDDDCYNEFYRYLDNYGRGFKLRFDYSSLININGKNITMLEYLKRNTTDDILVFLVNHVYHKHDSYDEYVTKYSFKKNNILNTFNRIITFVPKVRKKIKHEVF